MSAGEATTTIKESPFHCLPRPTLLLPGHGSSRQNAMHQSPPIICEQGPSAPSSPTSPDNTKRLCGEMTEDALHRIHLLTAGYGHDFGKLSPTTYNYATSDLGSSPRSSFSGTSNSLGPWTAYRDQRKNSFDLDDAASDYNKDLLSPGMMLSPAPPLSPFSDCETPYSSFARSPNLSPNPSTSYLNHFNFDRSLSSMSGRHDAIRIPSPYFFDQYVRERSRSDSDMSPQKDEKMETSMPSTISVPTSSRRPSSSGQYKKRLLQKYQEEQNEDGRHRKRSSSSPPPSVTESDYDDVDIQPFARNGGHLLERSQSPNPAEECRSGLERVLPKAAMSGWIENQMMLLTTALLQVPNPQLLAPPPPPHLAAAFTRNPNAEDAHGPIKGATLWRRSRSENDVSRNVQPIAHNFANGVYECSICGAGFSCHDRLAKHIASRHRERGNGVDDDAKIHKCDKCPKKFTRSDMLTRHMRLHSGVKPYVCNLCQQVFSRSDHLSTHQRTHTGEKPYQCSKCNYTASRRDMITRHFRTHETRADVPEIPIAQLSLSSHSPSLSPVQPSFTVPLFSAAGPTGLSPLNSLPVPVAGHAPPIGTANPMMRNSLDVCGSSLKMSGARSAFQPAGGSRLLAPPPLMHSLSVPSSPLLQRQNSLSPGLSRQNSLGGYEPLNE